MPELNFVLPHWLYWAGLVLFPLIAMILVRRARDLNKRGRSSVTVAYFVWLTAGFLGLHRHYLRRHLTGLIYILPFVGVIWSNIEARTSRVDLSGATSEKLTAEFLIERAEKMLADGKEGAAAKLEEARAKLEAVEAQIIDFAGDMVFWTDAAFYCAAAILVFLIVDAILLPRLIAPILEAEENEPQASYVEDALPEEARQGTGEAPDVYIHTPITNAIDRLSTFTGAFVAYWSVIAVFVYYYEVLARYIFNSPTNWAHEGMFLMFGMQYLISGAYAYLTDAHVRVDVFYARLSVRGKAISDLLTSVFFFIFAGTLLWTGWTFFIDGVSVFEVSFTEWAIQYYPVKFAIFLGAVLIILQGVSKLLKDIVLLRGAGA
ncbi:MAG: TRAP transporter small permease subunit [Alphaproteobacteria bacterium]|nr:TRAP transporter small permease subunit [Alphaproteobacteria bacterium]